MVTTIQLSEDVKKILDRMKVGKETYEDVILNVVRFVENQKRKREDLLLEGCREMAAESLKISKEWEGALMDGLDKSEKW